MNKRTIARTAAILAAIVALPVSAGTVPADDAEIVEVTVFRDRAEVVRLASVELPIGASSVEFADIPYGVETDSIRVTAEGVLATLGPRGEIRSRSDRLPVSEDERIVVGMGRDTTPGYRDSPRRPGVKLWTLELGPGEKREILLVYSVRHPRDFSVSGLP